MKVCFAMQSYDIHSDKSTIKNFFGCHKLFVYLHKNKANQKNSPNLLYINIIYASNQHSHTRAYQAL